MFPSTESGGILVPKPEAGGFGLGGVASILTVQALAPGGFELLRSFLSGLDPVPAILLVNPVYQALAAIVAGFSVVGGYLASQLFEVLAEAAQREGSEAFVAVAYVVFLFALLGVALDLSGVLVDSVPLQLLALAFDAQSAIIAGVALAKSGGEGPLAVSFTNVLVCGLLSGGRAAAFDVAELALG